MIVLSHALFNFPDYRQYFNSSATHNRLGRCVGIKKITPIDLVFSVQDIGKPKPLLLNH